MDGLTGLINFFWVPTFLSLTPPRALTNPLQSNQCNAMQCNATQANKALVLPPPEENAIHLDLDDGGANDLIALLKERAGVDYALVPDAGVTIKAAAALAAVLALMAYLSKRGTKRVLCASMSIRAHPLNLCIAC